jgi:hypothetical protein
MSNKDYRYDASDDRRDAKRVRKNLRKGRIQKGNEKDILQGIADGSIPEDDYYDEYLDEDEG